MTERLQKILSARGVSSRRSAEALILEGKVTVNGVPALLGQKADPELDRIEVNGAPLPALQGARRTDAQQAERVCDDDGG